MHYKIVRRDGNLLKSLFDSPVSLVYPLNEWCEAKVGGLLVFNNLDYATEFKKYSYKTYYEYGWEIYECEVENRIVLPTFCIKILAKCSIDHIQQLWQHNFRVSDYVWPCGTEAYQKVKLTKILK